MFNSREYEWNDVTVLIGGKVICGITGVKYSAEQEKEAIYGKGNLPYAIQKGNITYSGSVTLLQSEIETLIANGGGVSGSGKGLLDLNVDIIVHYGNPSNGDVLRCDMLQGVQFTSEPHEWSQGDKNMAPQELGIVFLRLKHNV